MSKFAILSLAAAAAMTAGLAQAHPHVVSSAPASGAQVTASPKDVRIKFSEAPMAKFSAITVADSAGKPVKTAKTAVDAADKTQLIANFAQTLSPGVYKVTWKASGADTHKVTGSYSFTVK